VTYLRIALSGFAAIFVGMVGTGQFLEGISEQKATGLGAVSGGLLATIFSPVFWILAVSCLALFLAACRLTSRALRILLFWAPTLVICTLGFGFIALLTYAWVHSRNI
jgi:hypothetical protein